jgi:hypothetical protein
LCMRGYRARMNDLQDIAAWQTAYLMSQQAGTVVKPEDLLGR